MSGVVNPKYDLYINSIKSQVPENGSKGEEFSGVLDSALLNAEMTDLDKIFEKASEEYNIPVGLLKAVAKAESNFNPHAKSCAGAQGIMQLMPSTARSLGVSDPFDPEQNIMGGAKYLSQMMDKFKGNIALTLAAYNAGPGNVAKYGGVPPFPETQNYINKVIGYLRDNIKAEKTTGNIDENADDASVQISSDDVSELIAAANARQLLRSIDLSSSGAGLLQNTDYDMMMNIYRYELQSRMLKALSEKMNDEG